MARRAHLGPPVSLRPRYPPGYAGPVIPDAVPTRPDSPQRVRTWHPGWMGVVLGTGGAAVASLVDPLPGTRVDEAVGAALTLLATVGLLLLTPYVLRLRRHRDAATADLANPGLGAMYGTAPAALLIVGIALAQLGMLGWLPDGIAWVSIALVVVGVVLALAVGIAFFLRVVAHEQLPVPAISGAWFIPIVVLVLVPSGIARSVALAPSWSSTTALALAAAAWGAGVVLFLLLAPVIAWRLITYPAPPAHMAASWWIWLAPAGAGGLGLIALSRLTSATLGDPVAAVVPTLGLLGASALWGFAVWWALFAGTVVRRVARAGGGLPFHVGSWGFVFPTAAVAALTVELGHSWGSPLLSVVGAVGWFVTLLVWLRLAVQSVGAVRSGALVQR